MMDPRQQTLTPPMRRVRHASTGDVMEFPADATDDDIHAAFRSARASQQQGPGGPVVQTFLDGLQEFQQPASSLPNIGGGSVVGLTPEQTQSLIGTVQQSNQDNIRNRIMQQKAMQEAMEREKDRAQQIKLEQQRLKNDLAKKSYEQEFQKAQAEADFGRQKEMFGMESREAREMADYNHQLEALSPFTLSPGQERFDPVTMESTANSMNDAYAASLRNRGAGRGAGGQQPNIEIKTFPEKGDDGKWYSVTYGIDKATGTPLWRTPSQGEVATPSTERPTGGYTQRDIIDTALKIQAESLDPDQPPEVFLEQAIAMHERAEAAMRELAEAATGGGQPQPQPGPQPDGGKRFTITEAQLREKEAAEAKGKLVWFDNKTGRLVTPEDGPAPDWYSDVVGERNQLRR